MAGKGHEDPFPGRRLRVSFGSNLPVPARRRERPHSVRLRPFRVGCSSRSMATRRWDGEGRASMETIVSTEQPAAHRQHDPWNKGRLIGQKRPLKPKDVWTIRVRLQLEGRKRDLAMFNLAIDSKLRGCDIVRLTIDDVFVGGRVRDRATVIQKKISRPVQFEITEQTRSAIGEWLAALDGRRGRVVSSTSRTRRRASTPASSIDGWSAPGSTVRGMGRTRCAGRSRLRSTGRLAICGQYSCCSATRSWRVRSAISRLRWMTPSASRSRSSYRQ